MLRYNPETGALEDVPSDGQPAIAPGSLASNYRAGRNLSEPTVVTTPGAEMTTQGAPAAPPAAPDPVMPAPVAPVPVAKRTMMGGQTTVTREKPTANELTLNKQIAESGDRMAEIAGHEGEAKVHAAEATATAAQRAADAAVGAPERREAVASPFDKKLQELNGVADSEEKKFSGMTLEEFGAGEPGWKRAARAIAVGFGAIGRALSKGNHNAAAEIVSQQMAEHYQVQRARIEKQKDVIAGVRQRAGDVRQSRADALATADAAEIGRSRALMAQADAEAARVGTEFARTQAEKVKEAARQHILMVSQNIEQGLRAKSSTTTEWRNTEGAGVAGGAAGGKPPTEAQAKTALLAQQMLGELSTIESNPQLAGSVLDKMQSSQAGAETANKVAGSGLMGMAGVSLLRGAGVLPKSKYDGLSSGEQKVANAWDNAVEKYARVLTGAGMPVEEANRMAVQDAPHAGDSPDLVQQKLQRMKAAASQMLALSGQAGAIAQQASPRPAGARPDIMGGAKIVMVRDRKTGAMVRAIQGVDGKLVQVD